MTHLHEVRITNFQSHKQTVLKLVPGVNAIVGHSDSGKSALFRSLAWAITNKPTGDSFRSKWGGDTSVTVEFADRTSVERAKVGKDNLYVLNEDDDNPFTAFKNDIPDAIFEALNMDEINMEPQMGAPFLLSASSGDVAKMLNKIANLSNIDTSLSNIRKRTQEVARNIKNVTEQVEELEKEEKSFAYLDQMEKDVEAMYKLQDRWQATDDERSELEHLIEALKEDQNDLDEVNGLLSNETFLLEALALSDETKRLAQETTQLEFILQKIEQQNAKLQKLPDEREVVDLLSAAEEINAKKEELRVQWLDLNRLIKSTTAMQSRLGELDQEIAALDEQFHDEFPDECPLCGGAM